MPTKKDSLRMSRIAFIIDVNCEKVDLSLIARKMSQVCHLQYTNSDEIPEDGECVMNIDLDDSTSYNWLKEILSCESTIQKISYLLIKTSVYRTVPDLTYWFKTVTITKDLTILPENIKENEITYNLLDQILEFKRRDLERYIKTRIGEVINKQLTKPHKRLTEIRKVLLRKEIEQYGTLEEVLKALQ